MLVATILLSLSSLCWAHDTKVDAALNASRELASNLSPRLTGCSNQSSECSDDNFSQVMSGYHGHLLFGRGPFYISHLPLFAPPHNYQAIYEVEFPEGSDEVKSNLVSHMNTNGYATFAPSANPNNPSESSRDFKIPQLTCRVKNDGQQVFWGDVHSDHFERGGKRIGNVGFKIKRVVFYKELSLERSGSDSADPNSEANFIVFGHSGQYFTARVIEQRPSVDQIFPIESSLNDTMLPLVGDLDHVEVQSSSVENEIRVFKTKNQNIPVKVQNFYTEVRELQ